MALIEEHRESLALVMFSGVQYYTGQLFDMKTITSAAKGAVRDSERDTYSHTHTHTHTYTYTYTHMML